MATPDGHDRITALLRDALAMLDREGEQLAAIYVSHALEMLGGQTAADPAAAASVSGSQPNGSDGSLPEPRA